MSEHWFVYMDDPIAIMCTKDDGKADRIKFVKNEYAEKHWNSDEVEALKTLRRLYPDNVAEWWQSYDEIREAIIELFPRNKELIALLKPKPAEHKTKAQPGMDPSELPESMQGGGYAIPTEADVARMNAELVSGSDDDRFSLMEAMDEKQIIEYMEGRFSQDFFYEFPVGGVIVIGMSFAGTIQAAKVISAEHRKKGGGIEVMPGIMVEDLGDEWEAVVYVHDKAIDFTVAGVGSSPKTRYNKKKKAYEKDPFARRSAVSKAERNAIRQLIPEDQILNMYRQWKAKKDKGPKNVTPGER